MVSAGEDGLRRGVFERVGKGGGFLRASDLRSRPEDRDIRVDPNACRDLGLRGGETLETSSRSGAVTATAIVRVDGLPPAERAACEDFRELTAIDPHRPMRFETPGGPLSMRVIDLLTPVGFGQRGLIVAPPRCGKTVLLQEFAHGAAENHPELEILLLLVDERPEEVTDMRRNVPGEVIASSNDRRAEDHTRAARFVIERAKRLVEVGRDVLILLDSITRLGRAFNQETRSSGRSLSGGLDIKALSEPKSIFGAARETEGGGSLTILATGLVETGSRMDDVIFSEFKGTGNLEIVLSRELSDRRIWPAIDLRESGTRREELLLDERSRAVAGYLRRVIGEETPPRAMQLVTEILRETASNQALLDLGA